LPPSVTAPTDTLSSTVTPRLRTPNRRRSSGTEAIAAMLAANPNPITGVVTPTPPPVPASIPTASEIMRALNSPPKPLPSTAPAATLPKSIPEFAPLSANQRRRSSISSSSDGQSPLLAGCAPTLVCPPPPPPPSSNQCFAAAWLVPLTPFLFSSSARVVRRGEVRQGERLCARGCPLYSTCFCV
jgi:hypothetical protein